MRILFTVLVSLLCYSLVSCAQVTVKDNLDCSALLGCCRGCWFEDPTIWVNDTLPGPSDDVVIFGNSTTGPLFFMSNATFQVGSLSLYNASLGVTGSAFLSSSVFIDSDSRVTVFATAVLTVNVSLVVNGNLSLISYAVLKNGGYSNSASFVLHENANLETFDNSNFDWNSDCELYGSLAVDNSSGLYCQNMTLLSSTTGVVSVLSASTLNVLPLNHVFIPNGFVGDFVSMTTSGMLTVNNRFAAQVQASNPLPPSNSINEIPLGPFARLELVNVSNAQLTPILYSDMPGISGPVVLVVTNSKANISISYAEHNIYWIYLLALESSTVNIDNLWTRSVYVGNSSSLLLGNSLKVETEVEIDSTSSLSVTQDSANFSGLLINKGELNLVNTLLVINGSYSQGGSGVLKVDLLDEKSSSLDVNGNVTLAGSLQYYIRDAPYYRKSVTYLVATYTNLIGAFSGNAQPLPDSDLQRILDISYNANKLSVVYSFHATDIPHWIWVLVGVAGAAVITIIVLIVLRKRYKRTKYDSL